MTNSIQTFAPQTLIDGYRRFKSSRFPASRDRYETLSNGQQPHTFVISCSDSRVDPAAIFDAEPGELFVVRNVANLVPSPDRDGRYCGVSSALEYAVKVLKVKSVLVLGHAQCGGVRACAEGLDNLESEYLGAWLETMGPARDDALAKTGGDDMDALSSALELQSVQASVERLRGFSFVADSVAAGTLELHGARFSIRSGALEWMTSDGVFVSADIDAS